MLIKFILNQKEMEIEAAPDKRVVDFFREDLGLTGTKKACENGDCGACTILVNGELKLSCLMFAAQLNGSSIVTIEGVSQENGGLRLQEAFVHAGAVQCGFCTPGMLLSSWNLLNNNPKPTRDEIRNAISGNLCRCTGYQKILDAVERFVEESDK